MFKAVYLPKVESIESLIPEKLIDEIDSITDRVIDGFKIKTSTSIQIIKPKLGIISGFKNYLLQNKLLTKENYYKFEEYYDRETWKLSGYFSEFLKTNFPQYKSLLEEFYGKEFIGSPFKSIEICEEIINYFDVKYEIKMEFLGYKMRYLIFMDQRRPELFKITYFLGFLLKGLVVMVYLSEKYNRKKEIDVYVYPTKYEKKIHSGDFIGPRSINSGFSIHSEKPVICIFRDEEKEKVLIHEIIHVLGFDVHNSEIDQMVKGLFGLEESSLNIVSESWVDYWAIVINCILNGYLIGENPNKLLMIEREYSIKQAYEVIKKLGYNLDELNRLEELPRTKFISSSAISYYVIKSGLLIGNIVREYGIDSDIIGTREFLRGIIGEIIGKLVVERRTLEKIIGGLRENDLRMTYIDIVYNNDIIV